MNNEAITTVGEGSMSWRGKIGALWVTVILLAFFGIVHITAAIQTFFYTELSLMWTVISIFYFAVAGWLLGAFAFTYGRLAVRLKIQSAELHARGLFGQRWRIPLAEIEAFREAEIFRQGRKQPVLQVGVMQGGMGSFVEALQKKAPNLKVVQTEQLQKQGRL